MKEKKYSMFALLILFFREFSLCCYADATAQKKTYPVNVGLLLDDLNSREAIIWKSWVDLALSDFYSSNSHYKSRLVWNTRDSKKTVVGAAAAAVDLIKKSQVQAILGPVTSKQANFVISLGDQAQVPILSFSATSPALTVLRSTYFFQLSENDSYQVRAISALVKEFKWRQVVPVLVDNEFAEGVLSSLSAALQKIDAVIPHRSFIRASATDDQIIKELYKLKAMTTRVFVVHMTNDLSSRLFAKAKELGMMSAGYVWIATTQVLNGLKSLKLPVIQSMQGVVGVQTYIPRTKKLEELELRWKLQFQRNHPTIVDARLDVVGLRLYDAVHALTIAVEKAGFESALGFEFKTSNTSLNLLDLDDTLGISKNGAKLCEALSRTRFEGIFGDFSLVDRQLKSSTFEVVNVNGEGATTIGFWTMQNGLVRTLEPLGKSSSKSNLGPVIWAGESLTVPSGLDPNNGKKWRIGVRVMLDFTDLVNITNDTETGTTNVTGLFPDFLRAVVEGLPYPLPYELIPFAKPDGSSAGTENELCYQVHLGKYDAVFGDVIVNAKMSEYVDYSIQYTEADIDMVVPADLGIERKSVLVTIFMPWSWDLWLAAFCCYLFTAFVLWLLEPEDNDMKDRHHVLYRIGIFVFLAFPIIYLTYAERVRHKLSKFVIIVWIIFFGILYKSYDSGIQAEYTKPQTFKPVRTDINYLLKKGENVGYIAGAYTFDILKQAGFHSSNLKGFETMKEIHEALTKGTADGGVGAFVAGTFYVYLFQQKYCRNYAIVAEVFKTMGYAFVLPKRSPLQSDISQAVLNLRERGEIRNMTNLWLEKQTRCPKVDTSNGPRVLAEFWPLFLVLFACSILALVVHYKNGLWEKLNGAWSQIVATCKNLVMWFNDIVT